MNAPASALESDMRIEICGGIAAGKTTLAQLVGRIDVFPLLEDFQSNPFWKPFYADPVGTAFETEITFLLQHYHDIKTAAKQTTAFACDFSPLLDLGYAHVTLEGGKHGAFLAVHQEVRSELQPPILLIHLVCEPQVELERIRRRGRDAETSITVEYLDAINQALAHVLVTEAPSWNVLTIDSAALDFSANEADKQSVLDSISARLEQVIPSFS